MWQRTRSEIEIVLEARAVHALRRHCAAARPVAGTRWPNTGWRETGKWRGARARAVGRAHCAPATPRPPRHPRSRCTLQAASCTSQYFLCFSSSKQNREKFISSLDPSIFLISRYIIVCSSLRIISSMWLGVFTKINLWQFCDGRLR